MARSPNRFNPWKMSLVQFFLEMAVDNFLSSFSRARSTSGRASARCGRSSSARATRRPASSSSTSSTRSFRSAPGPRYVSHTRTHAHTHYTHARATFLSLMFEPFLSGYWVRQKSHHTHTHTHTHTHKHTHMTPPPRRVLHTSARTPTRARKHVQRSHITHICGTCV